MLSNKVYDVLKWVAIVCLPALQVAIPALFAVWDIPYGEEIGKTLQIVAVCLAALLGVSAIQYNKNEDTEDGGVI